MHAEAVRSRARVSAAEVEAAEMRKAIKRKYEETMLHRTAKSTKEGYRRMQRVFCEKFVKSTSLWFL